MRAQPSRSVGLKRNVELRETFEKPAKSQTKRSAIFFPCLNHFGLPQTYTVHTGAVMRNNRRRLAQLRL
jgi:hypothetical protein